MSLVESLINQISTNELGGITKPQGFDMNDNMFENLLQKALASNTEGNDKLNFLGEIGQPAGIIIEPFEQNSNIQPIENKTPIQTEPFEMKDIDTGIDYFANLLKDAPQEHKSILNVARKNAYSAYNTFGKTFVDNLLDFTKDLKSAI